MTLYGPGIIDERITQDPAFEEFIYIELALCKQMTMIRRRRWKRKDKLPSMCRTPVLAEPGADPLSLSH